MITLLVPTGLKSATINTFVGIGYEIWSFSLIAKGPSELSSQNMESKHFMKGALSLPHSTAASLSNYLMLHIVEPQWTACTASWMLIVLLYTCTWLVHVASFPFLKMRTWEWGYCTRVGQVFDKCTCFMTVWIYELNHLLIPKCSLCT